MEEENAIMQACEAQDWTTKGKAILDRRIRQRTNCECICNIADELATLDRKYKALAAAIKANPTYISESARALWPAQYKAMGEYKKALQARIIDLIETDKD